MATGLPPAARPILLAAMLLFGAYLAWDLARWRAAAREPGGTGLTPGQFRRRLALGLILELDFLLWLLADLLLQGRPARERLLYLLVATLLIFVALFLAVREAAFVLRRYSVWRRELARDLRREAERGGAPADREPGPPGTTNRQ